MNRFYVPLILFRATCLVTPLTAALAVPSLAAPVTFVIDPSQSSLSVSGTVFINTLAGLVGVGPLVEQSPGSLTAPVSGTIDTQTDLSTYVQIQPSTAIFAANTGTYLPNSASDNYGALNGGPGLVFDAHNSEFSMTSGSLPLIGGDFQVGAGGSQVQLVSMATDTDLLGGLYSIVFQNLSSISALGLGELTVDNGVAQIDLPFYGTYVLTSNITSQILSSPAASWRAG